MVRIRLRGPADPGIGEDSFEDGSEAGRTEARRELEEGFNGLEDTRDERIKSMKELAAAYLEEYRMRHRSFTFAEYAVGNLTRHLGELMAVDVTDKASRTIRRSG